MGKPFNRQHFLNHLRDWPGPVSTPMAGVPTASMDDPDPPAEPAPLIGERFLSVPEVAVILGVSPKTVQRRLAAGLLRKAPLGGRVVRIAAAELMRFAGGSTPRDDANTIKGEP